MAPSPLPPPSPAPIIPLHLLSDYPIQDLQETPCSGKPWCSLHPCQIEPSTEPQTLKGVILGFAGSGKSHVLDARYVIESSLSLNQPSPSCCTSTYIM